MFPQTSTKYTLTTILAALLLVAVHEATSSIIFLNPFGEPESITFAVQVCAGLFNRHAGSVDAVYTLGGDERDAD